MELYAQQETVNTTGSYIIKGLGTSAQAPNEVTIIASAPIVIGGSEDNATYPIAADTHFPINVKAQNQYWVKAVTGTATVDILNVGGLDPADASDDSGI